MDEEQKKKEYLKNWQGNQKDAESMQAGFKKAGEMPEGVKKAWEGIAGLFTGKAQAAKKKKEDY